jgi:hypothetical protein
MDLPAIKGFPLQPIVAKLLNYIWKLSVKDARLRQFGQQVAVAGYRALVPLCGELLAANHLHPAAASETRNSAGTRADFEFPASRAYLARDLPA